METDTPQRCSGGHTTSRAKTHLISFALRPVFGTPHNKPGDVKFNILLGSFALFPANLHTAAKKRKNERFGGNWPGTE